MNMTLIIHSSCRSTCNWCMSQT